MFARIRYAIDDFRQDHPRVFWAGVALVLLTLVFDAWLRFYPILGAPNTPVASQLHWMPQYCGGSRDMAQHPDLVVDASYERLRVGFHDGVTVWEANAALSEAGVRFAGANARYSQVCVVVRGAKDDFIAMDRAKKSLRENPAVKYAAMDIAHSINPPIDHDVTF